MIEFRTAIILARISAIEKIMIDHGGDEIQKKLAENFKEEFKKIEESGQMLKAGERENNDAS